MYGCKGKKKKYQKQQLSGHITFEEVGIFKKLFLSGQKEVLKNIFTKVQVEYSSIKKVILMLSFVKHRIYRVRVVNR